jgi:hypothetical protein
MRDASVRPRFSRVATTVQQYVFGWLELFTVRRWATPTFVAEGEKFMTRLSAPGFPREKFMTRLDAPLFRVALATRGNPGPTDKGQGLELFSSLFGSI